jgi:hypothetical protein
MWKPEDATLCALLMRLYMSNANCRAVMVNHTTKLWEWTGPCLLARVTYSPLSGDLKMSLVPYSGPRP